MGQNKFYFYYGNEFITEIFFLFFCETENSPLIGSNSQKKLHDKKHTNGNGFENVARFFMKKVQVDTGL